MRRKSEGSTRSVNVEQGKSVDTIDGIAAPAPVDAVASRPPLSLESVVSMRNRGLSLAEIGKVCGVSKQAVSQLIKRHGLEVGTIEAFKSGKADILHSKQKLILDSITEAEVAKMKNVRDKAVAFGILYDKTAHLEGKSGILGSTISIISIALKAEASQPIDVTPDEVGA